jgi:hypothetical protein
MTLAAPVATVGVAACRHRPVTAWAAAFGIRAMRARQAFTDEMAEYFMARLVARNTVNSCAVARLEQAMPSTKSQVEAT